MNRHQLSRSLMLLAAALIWGVSYVAQSDALNYTGPLTFMFARSFVSCLVLGPMALIFHRRDAVHVRLNPRERRDRIRLTLKVGALSGIVFGIAVAAQQIGQGYTSVGKAGFITGIYIIWVPLIGLFFRRRISPGLWPIVALAVIGLYVLCIDGSTGINIGDLYCLVTSLFVAMHILILARWAHSASGFLLSFQQYFIMTIFMGILMLFFEAPRLGDILAAWKPLLYTAVLSNAGAGTLQIFGQRDMNSTVASLIMSLEAPLAVLSGLLILGQRMSARELIGCLIMFVAIVLAQLPLPGTRRMAEDAQRQVEAE